MAVESVHLRFQCSSTSRNSQNYSGSLSLAALRLSFSALLRAEIPKMTLPSAIQLSLVSFQCSSTSRNSQNCSYHVGARFVRCFQCSSTSRNSQNLPYVASYTFRDNNFQCSSTSRNSQNLVLKYVLISESSRLSVLFYEPKFPKSTIRSILHVS